MLAKNSVVICYQCLWSLHRSTDASPEHEMFTTIPEPKFNYD